MVTSQSMQQAETARKGSTGEASCTHLVYLQIMTDSFVVGGWLRHGRRSRGRGRKRAFMPGSILLLGIPGSQPCGLQQRLLADALALKEADNVVQVRGLP